MKSRPAMNLPTATTSSPILWREWIDRHAELFYLYARQQTRTEADAKDVLQDALTEAWTKTAGGIPDKAMVFATIRRRAVDLGRSMDRRLKREQSAACGHADWFLPDFSAGDTRDVLAAAVLKLPPDLREVLMLRIWGDLSFPAIAQLTGVPTATATSRYRYALEHLREHLAELQP
jgi:RNA polymerase sigma-70 factor (ECF subfamily)